MVAPAQIPGRRLEVLEKSQVSLHSPQHIPSPAPCFLLSPFPRLPALTLLCSSLTNLPAGPRTVKLAASVFCTSYSSRNI